MELKNYLTKKGFIEKNGEFFIRLGENLFCEIDENGFVKIEQRSDIHKKNDKVFLPIIIRDVHKASLFCELFGINETNYENIHLFNSLKESFSEMESILVNDPIISQISYSELEPSELQNIRITIGFTGKTI